jgi:lysophospholipase L1-like esterase
MSVAFLLLLAAPQDAPAGRWAFDAGAQGAQVHGRCEFVPSPVGAAGNLLSLNGVDAFVEIGGLPAPKEWALSFWMLPLDLRAGGVLSRSDGTRGWSLGVKPDGTLRLETASGKEAIEAAAKVSPGQWYHVALLGGEQAGLLLNRRPSRASVDLAVEAGAPLRVGKSAKEPRPFAGLIDDVRFWARRVGDPEWEAVVREGLPWVTPRENPPFGGTFELRDHDVVAFLGGENLLAALEAGYLETLLAAHAGKKPVHFRNLAWEGDTAYEQRRVLNFGTWEQQLGRAYASVLVLQFGQVEALEGKAGLERFTEAYGKLIARLAAHTRRLVVLSPTAFEKAEPPLPDLSGRNADLALYVEAARALAARERALFVDLSKTSAPTRDGIHLTDAGHRKVAEAIAAGLGLTFAALDERLERVRPLAREKNRLWLDHWRPTNWAFLNGDRTEQPSSRDHRDHRVRWFPVEVQTGLALVRREEAKIHAFAAELAR